MNKVMVGMAVVSMIMFGMISTAEGGSVSIYVNGGGYGTISSSTITQTTIRVERRYRGGYGGGYGISYRSDHRHFGGCGHGGGGYRGKRYRGHRGGGYHNNTPWELHSPAALRRERWYRHNRW